MEGRLSAAQEKSKHQKITPNVIIILSDALLVGVLTLESSPELRRAAGEFEPVQNSRRTDEQMFRQRSSMRGSQNAA